MTKCHPWPFFNALNLKKNNKFFYPNKIINNLVSLDRDYFFTFNTNTTRSNGLKIYKPRFNTTTRGHSFSQRIINDWNTVPHEIVSAPNVLIFKTKLDIFLYNRRFDFI